MSMATRATTMAITATTPRRLRPSTDSSGEADFARRLFD